MDPSPLDDLYMKVAKMLKTKGVISKDPVYQVGVMINFHGKKGEGLNNKRWYVVHAEANAIIKRSSDIKGCVLYTTLSPCNECAKLIIQSEIIKVVYVEDKPDKIEFQAGRSLLQEAGIALIRIQCKE